MLSFWSSWYSIANVAVNTIVLNYSVTFAVNSIEIVFGKVDDGVRSAGVDGNVYEIVSPPNVKLFLRDP